MATKYNTCDSIQRAQADELVKVGRELSHTGTALKLSQSESRTLGLLIENQKESQNILTKQFALDISKEKRKTKRWRRVSILEGLGIIGLILLL